MMQNKAVYVVGLQNKVLTFMTRFGSLKLSRRIAKNKHRRCKMSNITKRALAQSLKKIMLIKELDKITITDITNDCGMNRQTFYYHFKDIYDLLEWIFANEVIDKVEKETTIENWQENFKYVLDYMLQNKRIVIKIYNSLKRKTLLDFLFKQYNNIFIQIIENLAKNYNITQENKVFIANFYKYGFAGIIENWINTEMKEEPNNIISKLDVMISGSFEEAVKKMST